VSTIASAPAGLSDLGPIAQLRAGRLGRRLPQLYVGLVLYGVSLGLMVRGALGLAPWDVLHSGLIRHVPITLGQAVVLMSFVVLLLWIPLRESPGLGTISNAIVVGLSADATLGLLERPDAVVLRLARRRSGASPPAETAAPRTAWRRGRARPRRSAGPSTRSGPCWRRSAGTAARRS
jgi:hypothetical protein